MIQNSFIWFHAHIQCVLILSVPHHPLLSHLPVLSCSPSFIQLVVLLLWEMVTIRIAHRMRRIVYRSKTTYQYLKKMGFFFFHNNYYLPRNPLACRMGCSFTDRPSPSVPYDRMLAHSCVGSYSEFECIRFVMPERHHPQHPAFPWLLRSFHALAHRVPWTLHVPFKIKHTTVTSSQHDDQL